MKENKSNNIHLLLANPETKDHTPSYSDEFIRAVTELNILHIMNTTQMAEFLKQLKQERDNDLQMIEGLRRIGTPSAVKTIEEIEQTNTLVDLIEKSGQEYMSLKGTGLDVFPVQTNGHASTPKALRDSYLYRIIGHHALEKPFDIEILRRLAFTQYPQLFNDKNDFYGVYWRVMRELESANKVKVVQRGKGRRPTVFARIAEVTAKD